MFQNRRRSLSAPNLMVLDQIPVSVAPSLGPIAGPNSASELDIGNVMGELGLTNIHQSGHVAFRNDQLPIPSLYVKTCSTAQQLDRNSAVLITYSSPQLYPREEKPVYIIIHWIVKFHFGGKYKSQYSLVFLSCRCVGSSLTQLHQSLLPLRTYAPACHLNLAAKKKAENSGK
jgi:hypothetical protein